MIIGLSGKKQHGKDTVCKIIQDLTAPELQDYCTVQDGKMIPMKGVSSWQRRQFSSKLKQVVAILIGCTVEQLEDNTFKETPLGNEWKKWCLAHYKWDNENNPGGRISGWFNSKEEAENTKENLLEGDLAHLASASYITAEILTPRRILQLMGTEAGRNIIHPHLWINALLADYNGSTEQLGLIDSYPNWIITDVRFPNEAEAIKKMGGLVFRVERLVNTSCNCGVSYQDHFENGGSKFRHPYTPRITDNHPSEIALDQYQGFDGYIENNSDLETLVTKVKSMLQKHKIL